MPADSRILWFFFGQLLEFNLQVFTLHLKRENPCPGFFQLQRICRHLCRAFLPFQFIKQCSQLLLVGCLASNGWFLKKYSQFNVNRSRCTCNIYIYTFAGCAIFRLLPRSHKGCIFPKSGISYQESNISNQTKSNTNYTINRLLSAWMNGKQPKCHCDMLLLFPWTNTCAFNFIFSRMTLGMAKCNPFWAGHGSSGYVFRASFARLSRTFRSAGSMYSFSLLTQLYYRVDTIGLSRIFRKPFANVYISRKVPFALVRQIYACGPRSYKTFHGFLHGGHIYSIMWYNIQYSIYYPQHLDSSGFSLLCHLLSVFHLLLWFLFEILQFLQLRILAQRLNTRPETRSLCVTDQSKASGNSEVGRRAFNSSFSFWAAQDFFPARETKKITKEKWACKIDPQFLKDLRGFGGVGCLPQFPPISPNGGY